MILIISGTGRKLIIGSTLKYTLAARHSIIFCVSLIPRNQYICQIIECDKDQMGGFRFYVLQ